MNSVEFIKKLLNEAAEDNRIFNKKKPENQLGLQGDGELYTDFKDRKSNLPELPKLETLPEVPNINKIDSNYMNARTSQNVLPPEEVDGTEGIPEVQGVEDNAAFPVDDADYIGAPEEVEDQPEELIMATKEEKLITLFDYFKNIEKNCDLIIEMINDIDKGLLADNYLRELYDRNRELVSLKEKVKFFLINKYVRQTYETALYSYATFRKEFVEILKTVREILRSNSVKTDEDDA